MVDVHVAPWKNSAAASFGVPHSCTKVRPNRVSMSFRSHCPSVAVYTDSYSSRNAAHSGPWCHRRDSSAAMMSSQTSLSHAGGDSKKMLLNSHRSPGSRVWLSSATPIAAAATTSLNRPMSPRAFAGTAVRTNNAALEAW